MEKQELLSNILYNILNNSCHIWKTANVLHLLTYHSDGVCFNEIEIFLLAVEEIPLYLGIRPYDGSPTNLTSLAPKLMSTPRTECSIFPESNARPVVKCLL